LQQFFSAIAFLWLGWNCGEDDSDAQSLGQITVKHVILAVLLDRDGLRRLGTDGDAVAWPRDVADYGFFRQVNEGYSQVVVRKFGCTGGSPYWSGWRSIWEEGGPEAAW
jgi:hypothetical protein